MMVIHLAGLARGSFKIGDVVDVGPDQYKILGFKNEHTLVVRRTFRQWCRDVWAATVGR